MKALFTFRDTFINSGTWYRRSLTHVFYGETLRDPSSTAARGFSNTDQRPLGNLPHLRERGGRGGGGDGGSRGEEGRRREGERGGRGGKGEGGSTEGEGEGGRG